MKYFVGAYASSPNVVTWDTELESRYYNELKKIKNIGGLEHPFAGQLHSKDDDWFLANIDPEWEFVFTCIPGIMGAIGKNPDFGIASDDEAGRQEALAFMKQARDAIEKLNTHSRKNVVRAIQIQTSPNKKVAQSSKESLKRSLEEMLTWDWQNAQIVIEHCDAYVEGQNPSKGFLSLSDEIETIKTVNEKLGFKLGMVINWGRSAIETRSAEGALAHVKQAKDAGVLSGLMFSGASDKETAFGAWSDSHMPHQGRNSESLGEAQSLLTVQEMHACLQAADAENLSIVGVKFGFRPRETSLEDRVGCNKEALAIVDKYFEE